MTGSVSGHAKSSVVQCGGWRSKGPRHSAVTRHSSRHRHGTALLLKELKDRGYHVVQVVADVERPGIRARACGLTGCQRAVASCAAGEYHSGYARQGGHAPSRKKSNQWKAPTSGNGHPARAELRRDRQRLVAQAVLGASENPAIAVERLFSIQCELRHTGPIFERPSLAHAI